MNYFNVEIKAKVKDFNNIKKVLKENNWVLSSKGKHKDTYFKTNKGILKIRERNGDKDLIFYNKEIKQSPKKSNITLQKIDPKCDLGRMMTDSLEVLTVVEKQRDVYEVDHGEVHLDKIKDDGQFIEIELSDEKVSCRELEEKMDHYIKLFSIKEKDLISASYSDLFK